MNQFSLNGLDNLQKKLDQLLITSKEKVMESLLESGNDLKQTAIEDMHQSKSGKMYGSHQASAPGESPAEFYGKLIESIKVRQEGDSVIIGTVLNYGTYLELGTSRIAARPWLNPAYKKTLPSVIEKLNRINLVT